MKVPANEGQPPVNPRYKGQRRVTVGTTKWKESFFLYAHHLKRYFREYAAKLTPEQRRKLAADMGLPVQCSVCPSIDLEDGK
jgi:hypothetical protein